ncbi:MAG: PAS domain-containing protein [Myxococcota bacterium]|nr:PAS domain-containing protein [Myxococcota bacterium]
MVTDRLDAERARRGLHLVSAVVRTFSQTTADYPRLLETIARQVADAIPDTCIVTLRSEDGTTMTPVAAYDADPAIVATLVRSRRPYPMSEAQLSARVMTTGSVFLPALDLESARVQLGPAALELFGAVGARGVLSVPLGAGGDVHGVLTILRHRGEHAPLDALDREIVEDLAGHAALAIGNARLFARVQDELRRRTAAEHALELSERLRTAEARAVESSLFLDAIVDNIPDMVFVKDASRLSFVLFNRAGEALLGLTREGLLGKTDADLFPASEAEFFTAKDRETLRDKILVEIPEEPIHTRSGTRWLHTKKVPLLDETGTPRFLLGISHDITDRKRADAQLRDAKEALEHANRELESFAYSIAHDLRSPLRGILGYSQAVLEDAGPKLDAQPRLYLQRVQESAERMARLIDELLGLARITQAEIVRSRVDLTAIARASIAGLQQGDRQRRVEVTIGEQLLAHGDPHLLAIVVDNLLDNAWKFTAKRAVAHIEVGALEVDGRTAFFVRDDGAGFDMAYADQLFGVFRRLHPADEFPGTGIGLATVARIVHRHHGRVWADAEVGGGATFYFSLGEAS